MNIGVLGAGVIGVSTAYALARLGHEVTVIDKADQVAMGASHANGAQLSYAYIDPFAGPATRRKIPAYLLGLDPGIHLSPSLKPSYLNWGIQFLCECSPRKATDNLKKRSELAIKSREAIEIFESELPKNALKRSSVGKLVLAADQQELEAMRNASQVKARLGLTTKILSRFECLEHEPALEGWKEGFVGATYNDGDTSLDPITYCEALQYAGTQKFGVAYKFGETILAMEWINGATAQVITDKTNYEFEKIIVCLGAESQNVLKNIGTPRPILPMQGYSLTLPVKQPALKTSITDPKSKIVFTRIEGGIRIAGFMDANISEAKAQKRALELKDRAEKLWPDIADYSADPHFWTNYRPMTPSGLPMIGESVVENIYLNLGHGSLGYTFAAGSAMTIAEIIGHTKKND
ncbi:MAG: FAD-dependent oxidoreductase [Acidimicrobiales bacterium]|nr:FAD-dependent oxidoreductase [Hyphomonadaceae bacterium]RZV40998.1 MAG: FAD-dependent oxidoreductase [Acidimicrobiales bacterium]